MLSESKQDSIEGVLRYKKMSEQKQAGIQEVVINPFPSWASPRSYGGGKSL